MTELTAYDHAQDPEAVPPARWHSIVLVSAPADVTTASTPVPFPVNVTGRVEHRRLQVAPIAGLETPRNAAAPAPTTIASTAATRARCRRDWLRGNAARIAVIPSSRPAAALGPSHDVAPR